MYYRDSVSECDFLVRKNDQVIAVIQSCWQLDENNIEREVKGLRNAINESGAKYAKILTFNQDDVIDDIEVIPAWK